VQGVQRVMQCAARTARCGAETECQRTDVSALEELVRLAVAAGVQRIVHFISITVHGNDIRRTPDETAALREEPNPYSRSKVAGERLLEAMIREERAPVTIVRPGWIYGPGDCASFARLAAMIAKRRMVRLGAGANHLPLIYVTDAARGLILAGESPQAAGRTYLLVNDESVTQAEFLATIADELGVPAPTWSVPYESAVLLGAIAEATARLGHRAQPPPIMRYGTQLLGGENRFLIDRARRELGFTPEVDMAEGVKRSVEWYRATVSPLTRSMLG